MREKNDQTQTEVMKKGLSSDKIKNRFISSGISHISLFGSYARNEATKDSDLDLFIELIKDNKVTFLTLDKLENFLKKEFKISKVDFVTKKSLNNPYLKKYIEKNLINIF